MHKIRWTTELLDSVKIPLTAKHYLISEGFPEFFDNPYMEFGIYDSDVDLVIGEVGDCPIIVQEPDGFVAIENPEGFRLHLNRSVDQLGEFLNVWLRSERVVDARRAMIKISAESVEPSDSCFWGQALDYEEAIGG